MSAGSAPASVGAPAAWPLAGRILFRFAFSYFALFVLPLHFLWRPLVTWTSVHVLGLDQPVDLRANGSGDRSYNWIWLLLVAVCAGLACALWSLLDRRRVHYRRLAWWLLLGVRSYLATMMWIYGIAKLSGNQFVPPDAFRLTRELGEMSPMGLLWNFMGFSPAYTVFTGLAEIAGGLLLLFRRTATLGALLVAAVMANVVVLNFCYDVPVKIHSSHYFLFALALLLPEARRLVAFFFCDRPVRRRRDRVPLPAPWGIVVDILYFSAMTVTFITIAMGMIVGGVVALAGMKPPAIAGIYAVEEWREDGELRPLLVTDEALWRELVFAYPRTVQIRMMGGAVQGVRCEIDEAAGQIRLWIGPGEEPTALDYTMEEDQLVLRGPLGWKDLEMRARRRPVEEMELMSRGFRWINEYPYNR